MPDLFPRRPAPGRLRIEGSSGAGRFVFDFPLAMTPERRAQVFESLAAAALGRPDAASLASTSLAAPAGRLRSLAETPEGQVVGDVPAAATARHLAEVFREFAAMERTAKTPGGRSFPEAAP